MDSIALFLGKKICGIQDFTLNTAWAMGTPTPISCRPCAPWTNTGNGIQKRTRYTTSTKGWNESFLPPASTKAVRYLEVNQLNATDGDPYRKELDILHAENEKLARGLRWQNLDPNMLRQIKHCVDTVLAQAENVPEVKANVIKKLHRAQEQQAQATPKKDLER